MQMFLSAQNAPIVVWQLGSAIPQILSVVGGRVREETGQKMKEEKKGKEEELSGFQKSAPYCPRMFAAFVEVQPSL